MSWQEKIQLLRLGDYEKGWPDHKDILVGTGSNIFCSAPDYNKPVWCGQSEDITLLIDALFGDGDTVQFFRFIEDAKKRVKKIILHCNQEFENLFGGIEVLDKQKQPSNFDKVIHMMALPKVLKIKKNEIKGVPYLMPNTAVPPNPAIQVLPLLKFPKVGVCWCGNPFNAFDYKRSIPVNLLEILNVCDNFKFFSLCQIFDPPKNYFDYRNAMTDWNQTAHLVKSMDLVITVDTSIAHLAGSMGVKTWLLSDPEVGEWRWGDDQRTIWYDSVQIFRKKDDWQTLLFDVSENVKIFLEDHQQNKKECVCKPSAILESFI
jgi:hypothetical protein